MSHVKERREVFLRAQTLHQTLIKRYEREGVVAQITEEARRICNEDIEGTSMTRVWARIVWDMFYDDPGSVFTLARPKLVLGLFGGIEHAWYAVEGDPTKVQLNGDMATGEAAVPRSQHGPAWGVFRYIVDPWCPDVQPPCLLISPLSQMQRLYAGLELDPRCLPEVG